MSLVSKNHASVWVLENQEKNMNFYVYFTDCEPVRVGIRGIPGPGPAAAVVRPAAMMATRRPPGAGPGGDATGGSQAQSD